MLARVEEGIVEEVVTSSCVDSLAATAIETDMSVYHMRTIDIHVTAYVHTCRRDRKCVCCIGLEGLHLHLHTHTHHTHSERRGDKEQQKVETSGTEQEKSRISAKSKNTGTEQEQCPTFNKAASELLWT